MLTFEEQGHTYRWNGQVVPSVTEVLSEWVLCRKGYVHTVSGTLIDAPTFENAGDFGQAIHAGAKLILTDGLDWDALDPALVPPLKEFMRWLDDYKVKPKYVEQPMYSGRYKVAGTPDIIGELQGFRHLCLVDIKTGNHDFVAPQLYAYEMIFREQHNYRKPITKHVLYLPKDGGPYQFKRIEDQGALSFFLSRLYQYTYIRSMK